MAFGLFLAVLAVFGQTAFHGFVLLDDPDYVSERRQVLDGLSPKSIGWAFTTFDNGNWHPLSWLSHMLDVQLFGAAPGAHHLVSVLIHAAAALVLFAVLRRTTSSTWRSGLSAGLFAVHPLRVESVAWIAERKDVLCTLFFVLTLLAYVRYVERPKAGRYLAALGLFVLGILSKPMIVSLPVVLLLFDVWPLGRFGMRGGRIGTPGERAARLFLEKAPFFGLALVSCAITIVAQRSAGAILGVDEIPPVERVANAIVSYAGYLGKMAWPAGLAPFYPLRGMPPAGEMAAAIAILSALSGIAAIAWKRRPYLTVGWLWYLVTLVPVIGLVQVGGQAMADRYTYIPSVGIFVMVAWSVGDLAASRPRFRVASPVAVACVLVALGGAAFAQVRLWRTDLDLFGHAVKVTENNWFAHRCLGIALANANRIEEAMHNYEETLRLRPYDWRANNNLGRLLAGQGRLEDAVRRFETALRGDPRARGVRANLGSALGRMGRSAEAMAVLLEALRLDPDDAGAQYNLGNLLLRRGSPADAERHYRETLRIEPANLEARGNLGVALAEQGRVAEAIAAYREALRGNPASADIRVNLGNALLSQGLLDEAIAEYEEALRIAPAHATARDRLGAAIALRDRGVESRLSIGYGSAALREA